MSAYVTTVNKLHKRLSSRLGRLDIELTERCNNRCIHCYINQPADDPYLKASEMDTAFVQLILKQAADLGCLTVRFTGGEPLLREDFAEIYLYTRRLGLKVRIFTNARLVTPELAHIFARIPPGEPLEVSVYGMHARSYDEITSVPGAYDQFRQGITLLQQHQVPFVVKQSILPQNRDELSEFEAFAATLPHMDKPSYAMNFDLRTRRDDPARNRVIRRLRLSPQETLAMLTREPDQYIKNMREFAGKFMRTPGDKIFDCGAGLSACVDAYGQAQMCILLRHPDTVYPLDPALHHQRNAKTTLLPLEHALTVFFPQIRQMRSANTAYLKRCAVCFLKGLCQQCPAKSWEEHGTLDTPVEYLCQVAHAQATYLGLVTEGENSWELAPDVRQARLEVFTNAKRG